MITMLHKKTATQKSEDPDKLLFLQLKMSFESSKIHWQQSRSLPLLNVRQAKVVKNDGILLLLCPRQILCE